jgi:hypothetical protein
MTNRNIHGIITGAYSQRYVRENKLKIVPTLILVLDYMVGKDHISMDSVSMIRFSCSDDVDNEFTYWHTVATELDLLVSRNTSITLLFDRKQN